MNIRPTQFLVKTLFLLLLLSIVQLFYKELSSMVYLCLALFALAVIADFVLACAPVNCDVIRKISSTLPLGVASKVTLAVQNLGKNSLNFEIIDHYPSVHSASELPVKLILKPGQVASFEYRITPLERGMFEIAEAEIKANTLLGFWNRFCRRGDSSQIKVYPNYSEVMKYGILAAEQRLSQMGILKKRSRGQGTDFHQLREFRKGDRLNSIDWKSSSRLHKIISKDYQLEQDQQIFFLLDCGRRMRAMDGDLSHFDHAINAMLLLTYVASRQGDAVGMMTFAGPQRYLPPKKSSSNVNRFLNTLYDVHPTNDAADYIEAAENLKSILKKRSMVVILSNTREEDDEDLVKALKIIRKRHIVLFAALKEEVFEAELAADMNSFSDSLKYASLCTYLHGREKAISSLKQNNILTIDTIPAKLHVEMVNRYFEIKSSSVL